MMLAQTLLGEKGRKIIGAGGVREDCVSNRREGEKQQTRKHSGVQNETTQVWKGRRGRKERAVSQRHNDDAGPQCQTMTYSPGVRT